MTGLSPLAPHTVAASFPWESYKSFADVGRAQGGFAVTLASTHGHLSGIGYDLPSVRSVFEKYVAKHDPGERLRFHEGDFFKDLPPTVDVLYMGHILHDWNLEQKQLLVKKAYDALPTG
jgi:hypothetical protein